MPLIELRAQDVIDFIECLKLTGDFYGKPFILLPWQREVISAVYGTVSENGLRQYKIGYLEIPKKNGKTSLIAGLGLYHLVNDGPGGEIYCCAAEKEQAGITYRYAKSMIEQDPELKRLLRVIDSKKEIHNRETGTYMKVLSAEAYSKHGINPSIVIFDELHAQSDRDLWDTMTFGATSSRSEPLTWVITTAGNDPDRKSIGWEEHELARKIISGDLVDETFYAKIFGAHDDADIYDEDVWYECNPSLGTSISIETLRAEAVAARNSEQVERLFRWLRLNQWVSLKLLSWLPVTLWDDTEGEWKEDDLKGKYCYVGIDMSSKVDLTAVTCLFPPQPGLPDWRFIFKAFCPKDNIKIRSDRDHVDYIEWHNNGYLEATDGDVVDYGKIAKHIEEIEKKYVVKWYCGDPWHLEILKQLLGQTIAKKFIEIAQTMRGMTQGMGELERVFRAKLISHLKQPLGRWSFGNVAIATDGNENKKPMKNKSIERIDPTVSLINAMSGAVPLEGKPKSSYEERGIRMI